MFDEMRLTSSLQRECRDLTRTVTATDFQGGFTPSIYETLAVLLADFDKSKLNPTWNSQCISYLQHLENRQNHDGSWGSDPRIEHPPDRIITTLAALLSFQRYGPLRPDKIEAATEYVRRNITAALSLSEAKKTIAFDALLTELLSKQDPIVKFGILSEEEFNTLLNARNSQLENKTRLLLKSRGTIHSVLDALASGDVNWEQVAEFQEVDGSMGIYPSSTATLLSNIKENSLYFQRGLRYLQNSISSQGTFPPFYPSTEFERWWTLLALAQSPASTCVHIPSAIADSIPHAGISVSSSFSLPDVDTASMKATTLLSLGLHTDIHFLSRFYRDGVFVCYEHEARTSPSANIHALMAIVSARAGATSEYIDMLNGSLGYLLDTIGSGDHFEDKWHLSDLYTTSHAIELFSSISRALFQNSQRPTLDKVAEVQRRMVCYVLDHQSHEHGGFGFGCFGASPTIEETSYAVRAICMSQQYEIDPGLSDRLRRAHKFLSTRSIDEDPPLWLGKTLYKSFPIIRGNQLSAIAWLDSLSSRV